MSRGQGHPLLNLETAKEIQLDRKTQLEISRERNQVGD